MQLLDFGCIYSVWRRNFLVYRKIWLVNLLPPLSEPIVYLIGFGYGLGSIANTLSYHGINVPYIAYLCPGMVGVAVLLQGFFECAYGCFIRMNYQKVWAAIMTTPVSFTEVFVGELLWGTTKALFAGFLTALIGILIGAYTLNALLLSLPLLLIGGIVFSAFGMASAAFSKEIEHLQIPTFVLLIPMFSICGAYFPREGLPQWIRAIIEFLPFSPFIDLLRWHIASPSYPLLKIVLFLGWSVVLVVASYKVFVKKIFR
jgi:lipooligosaccharide transport system permease protein